MNECQAGQERVCLDACVVTDKVSLGGQERVCLGLCACGHRFV